MTREAQGVLTFVALGLILVSSYIKTGNRWFGWAIVLWLGIEAVPWIRRRRAVTPR